MGGVSASTQALYKPLGAVPVSQQDFPEYSTAEMATCRQKSCKPKAGLTNTLGGLGDLLVTKSHEHALSRAQTRYHESEEGEIAKSRVIGGEGRPVRGRTAYDHQFGIEQAERGRNFLKKEASLPTLGFWSHGQVPSLAVPDMHPVMLAGQTFKRVPMMSPGQ